MLKGLYGFLADQKMRQLNLFRSLEIAEEYHKVAQDPKELFNPDGQCKDVYYEPEEPHFISVDDDENERYVVIYGNLYMLFSINETLNDKIVQIYIKRPDDLWRVPVDENGNFDMMNPCNVKIEVYADYSVSVVKLNHVLSRCCGQDYRSGVWNKMFYRTIKSFVKKVDGYTEINQINVAYGN